MTAVRALVPVRVGVVWLALILATLGSWQLGTDHALTGTDREVATVAVLVVAFVKVRLVGLHFMELRDAPVPLRLVFEGYVAVVCLTLVGLYLGA
ncbi:MAG: hypothetical protein JWO02_3605 [Solirubrobacterales bacterium]|nr:hypothetical protein [Solirubrobacterales bacterium]